MKRFLLISMSVLMAILSVSAHKVKHPSLFYTSDRVEQAKLRMKQDTVWTTAWQRMLAVAERQCAKPALDKADYLSFAYRMTGDKRYADALKAMLLKAVEADSWGVAEMLMREPAWNSELGMGRKALMAAIAFDVVYQHLSAAERMTIAKGLHRLAVHPLLGDWLLEPTRIHSLNSMGHNWWTSCVCMGGILAMTLQNELPYLDSIVQAVDNALPQWFAFEGDVLQHKPRTIDCAGGMYESINYAAFGIQEALLFRLAWTQLMPHRKLTEISQLDKVADFFIAMAYPRDGKLYSANFGDSYKTATGETPLMLLYALGQHRKDILWYLSQVEQKQHREGYPVDCPMGFLYTPDLKKAPVTPALEKSIMFADMGWASLRSSWDKNATMLAVKSGYTWNHAHADANSFILYHKGTDIIKEAGRCWYKHPEYRNYFFQSEAHNVVLFDGQGQPREHQYYGSPLRGYLHDMQDEGNIKYILADGTGPNADRFSRYFRHFLWINQVIYVIDDLKSHRQGHFEWLWHPGGKVNKRGIDVTVTEGKSSVVIRPLYPRSLAPSDFIHDYPDDLYWETHEADMEGLTGKETYYSFHLPEKTHRVKAVTAIILKDSPEQKDLPVMEKREGKNWIGLRITDKEQVTDLYINQQADGRLMHANSWIDADGWKTDAYMFAVTYQKGTDPTRGGQLFMAYGSALRKGDVTCHASLVKQTFITKLKPLSD